MNFESIAIYQFIEKFYFNWKPNFKCLFFSLKKLNKDQSWPIHFNIEMQFWFFITFLLLSLVITMSMSVNKTDESSIQIQALNEKSNITAKDVKLVRNLFFSFLIQKQAFHIHFICFWFQKIYIFPCFLIFWSF